MAILPPRGGDVLIETLAGTQAIWGLTLYARLTGFLSVTWRGLTEATAHQWYETLLNAPGRGLCSDVWWYAWEHGVPSNRFGPWDPTRRWGPPQRPRFWGFTTHDIYAPCGHPLRLPRPSDARPWCCEVCENTAVFPIHRGPRWRGTDGGPATDRF